MVFESNSTEMDFKTPPPVSTFVTAAGYIFAVLVSLIVNVCFLKKLTVDEFGGGKGLHWLVKCTAVTGLVNGVGNGCIYAISTLTGKWVMTYIGCQLYGVIFYVMISGTVWLSTVTVLERMTKLIKPTEYNLTFSVANTKLIVVGIYVLLVLIFLSPIYAWGEFGYFKGSTDLCISLQRNTSECLPGRNESTPCEPPTQTETMELKALLMDYFRIVRAVHVRRSVVQRAEVCVTLRFEDHVSAEEYFNATVSNNLQRSFGIFLGARGSNVTAAVRFQTTIDVMKFAVYFEKELSYQGAMHCSLDFSHVNQHIGSFLGLVLITTVFSPFAVLIYCIVNAYRHLESVTLQLSASSFEHRMAISALVACSVIYVVYLNYWIINICAGGGLQISSSIVVLSNVTLFVTLGCGYPVCYLVVVDYRPSYSSCLCQHGGGGGNRRSAADGVRVTKNDQRNADRRATDREIQIRAVRTRRNVSDLEANRIDELPPDDSAGSISYV